MRIIANTSVNVCPPTDWNKGYLIEYDCQIVEESEIIGVAKASRLVVGQIESSGSSDYVTIASVCRATCDEAWEDVARFFYVDPQSHNAQHVRLLENVNLPVEDFFLVTNILIDEKYWGRNIEAAVLQAMMDTLACQCSIVAYRHRLASSVGSFLAALAPNCMERFDFWMPRYQVYPRLREVVACEGVQGFKVIENEKPQELDPVLEEAAQKISALLDPDPKSIN